MPQFQLVRIVNKGTKDIVDHYNSERFVIRAGDDAGTFVPWDAMVIWYGNPLAVNTSRQPARQVELERIHMRYGGFGDPAVWEANRPRVEVYTTDNKRIFPVMDDAEGTQVPTDDNSLSAEDLRQAEMDQMRAAIRDLQERLAVKDGEVVNGESAGPLPTDAPQAPPVGPSTSDPASGVALTITRSADLPEDAPQ